MPITVSLGSDVEKRLDTLAKLTGRTKTYYIRRAIYHYVGVQCIRSNHYTPGHSSKFSLTD